MHSSCNELGCYNKIMCKQADKYRWHKCANTGTNVDKKNDIPNLN